MSRASAWMTAAALSACISAGCRQLADVDGLEFVERRPAGQAGEGGGAAAGEGGGAAAGEGGGAAAGEGGSGGAGQAGGGGSAGSGGAQGGSGGAPTCEGRDLLKDARHCGACFHDCLGGDCVGGVCRHAKLATSSTMSGLYGLSLQGGMLWGTNYLGKSTKEPTGRVFVVAAGAPPSNGFGGWLVGPSPDGQGDDADAIVADGEHVYWMTDTSGALMRAKVDGSSIEKLFDLGAGQGRLARAGQTLYYTVGLKGAGLRRFRVDGKVSSPLLSGTTVRAVATEGGAVFFDTPSAVMSLPVDGDGPPTTVAELAQGSKPVVAIDADATHVYWHDGVRVYRALRQGGPVEPIEPDGGLGEPITPFSVDRDGDVIYVGSIEAESGKLWAIAKAGGGQATALAVTAPSARNVSAIVNDEKAIYWTTGDPPSASRQAALWRLVKPAQAAGAAGSGNN